MIHSSKFNIIGKLRLDGGRKLLVTINLNVINVL